ncbi:DUF5791 family protein [Halobacterium litoreum]|uniref:DUF5791 family protein n=1 Tax=Halobacterium litoreum TaxID=2039234 RepID=A0ABD5NGF4_9EURY|nr:DUF5791 family protein [Halobacterium litoreum]UHH12768.1 DUF5791 family protein [Halobacterium litoreum]
MLAEAIEDPSATSADEVLAEYEAAMADVVSDVGVETAAERSGVDEAKLAALVDGDAPAFTVEEAAAVFALSDDWPDAEGIVLEARDNLMLQMSSAVMDVDALASGLDGGLDPKEIQQKIEGRQPMTLAEYARIYHHVASENPY